MIIQTGMRTDIPAFYAEWLANRLRAGYVLVRNPYNPVSVTRYSLSPEVVDAIGFCTKNPEPMLEYLPLLEPYGQYWFVTITPYGPDIEPNVPPTEAVISSFRALSARVGVDSMGWRYDPILLNGQWTVEKHIDAFRHMAAALEGSTRTCVISFIDLYEKVKRNFPEARRVAREQRIALGRRGRFAYYEGYHDHQSAESAGADDHTTEYQGKGAEKERAVYRGRTEDVPGSTAGLDLQGLSDGGSRIR